ncbi:Kelch-like protein 5, partial [Eumeta japonica]
MLTNENWVFKSEKYSLSSDSVLNKFKHFWRDGTLCDVDLVSGDRVVKAHRVVLAATCVYFKTMFKSGFEESHKKCVTLPSIPPDVLPLIVEFIYTGNKDFEVQTSEVGLALLSLIALNMCSMTHCFRSDGLDQAYW